MAEDGQWAMCSIVLRLRAATAFLAQTVALVAGVGHRVGGAMRTKANASLLSRGYSTPRPGPPQPMMVAVCTSLVSLHAAAAAAAAAADVSDAHEGIRTPAGTTTCTRTNWCRAQLGWLAPCPHPTLPPPPGSCLPCPAAPSHPVPAPLRPGYPGAQAQGMDPCCAAPPGTHADRAPHIQVTDAQAQAQAPVDAQKPPRACRPAAVLYASPSYAFTTEPTTPPADTAGHCRVPRVGSHSHAGLALQHACLRLPPPAPACPRLRPPVARDGTYATGGRPPTRGSPALPCPHRSLPVPRRRPASHRCEPPHPTS
eukprot:gene4328-4607_t